MLISRPAGKEAFLALTAYQTGKLDKNEPIEIDCAGIKVMTPSWADEVITKLTEQFINVTLLNPDNASVQATLKTLRQYSGIRL